MNSIIMFGILIILFMIAFHFIQTNRIIIPQVNHEGFQVTSASDCACLPGYIPSNTKGKEKSSYFFCQSLSKSSDTKKCY